MEEYKKMISGEMYDPNAGYLKKLREENRTKLRQFNGEPDEGAREEILQHLSARLAISVLLHRISFFTLIKVF